MRSPDEVRADLAAAKAAGESPMGAKMRALRAELKEAERGASGPPAPAASPPPSVGVAVADDEVLTKVTVAFATDSKPSSSMKNAYLRVRAALNLKHIIEDSIGLTPTKRIVLPPWNTLGRENDTGRLFEPGETQATVDGTAQRAMPSGPKVKVTTPEGQPIPFVRSRRLDEPDGNATVTVGVGSAEEE